MQPDGTSQANSDIHSGRNEGAAASAKHFPGADLRTAQMVKAMLDVSEAQKAAFAK